MKPTYSFRFVCQGGGLDVKSAFLVASLRQNLRAVHELVAGIPDGPGISPPATEVREFLQRMGVRMESVRNPITSAYPIGHKLACLALPTTLNTRVFLDSDILCTRPFYKFPKDAGTELSAKLEDWNHHSDEEWNKLYSYLQLGRPDMRFRSTALNQIMPLYFNAGVLVVDTLSSLPQEWIGLARDIENNLDLPRKRPNLDQLALAATVIKKRVPWTLFSEDYNYPAQLRPLDHSRIPYFCHYHNPLMVLADEFLSGLVCRLCEEYTGLKMVAESAGPSGHWVWSSLASTQSTALYL